LIVLPHAAPGPRDDADWDAYQWAQALAEQGYVVISQLSRLDRLWT